MAEAARGTLFLVVGPSGAGKDSLLDAARRDLGSDLRYHFVQREITRPAEAGGEDHIPVSATDFSRRCIAGHYALFWQANGLGYGIPSGIVAQLDAGRDVICNASRAIVDIARERFTRLQVIVVTAPMPVLAQRIAARGRESVEEIEARLQRAKIALPQGSGVTVIVNDGELEDAARTFVSVLAAHRIS
ncbi:MAG: phosphonate metabolism protein/1,5-bisphosphokinase (PRPP-forming) PhnN [Alphaproteobacteria bacterium]|nr:phosphonate metabolism protein/1,5-bisphosphokinase (PRPP-forming) PhnN [Alphaproteobacteria bacterium]